jgi:hypothetical protein
MIRRSYAALAIIALAVCAIAQAQQPSRALPPGVVWSFDPASGTVHPLAGSGNPSIVTYTGTVNITVTIQLSSKVTSGSVLLCNGNTGLAGAAAIATALVSSVVLPDSSSSESVDAVVSGDTATCNFVIPYEWNVAVSSSTTTGGATVTGVYADVAIEEVTLGTTGAIVRVLRSTSVSRQTTTAPATSNATTTLTASTVL